MFYVSVLHFILPFGYMNYVLFTYFLCACFSSGKRKSQPLFLLIILFTFMPCGNKWRSTKWEKKRLFTLSLPQQGSQPLPATFWQSLKGRWRSGGFSSGKQGWSWLLCLEAVCLDKPEESSLEVGHLLCLVRGEHLIFSGWS